MPLSILKSRSSSPFLFTPVSDMCFEAHRLLTFSSSVTLAAPRSIGMPLFVKCSISPSSPSSCCAWPPPIADKLSRMRNS